VTELTRDAATPRVLLVGHDAFPSGAQHLLLKIGKTLRGAHGLDIEFFLLAGGPLEGDYAAAAPTTVLKSRNALPAKVRELCRRGFTGAIVNTSASGEVAALLADSGIVSVLLVHELPHLLREKQIEAALRAGIASARHVVFASTFGRDRIRADLELPPSEKFIIKPQGVYKEITADPKKGEELRQALMGGAKARLVLGVGYGDMRKGFDLFLQLWRLFRQVRPEVHFCWAGGIDPELKSSLAVDIAVAETSRTFHMAGYRNDVESFFSAADAFVLTSREDPFPTVALEAMGAGVPVLAFEGSGGIPELLRREHLGFVVPYCDVPAMAARLRTLLADGFNPDMRGRARETVETRFAFAPYVRDLLRLALPDMPSISVVVPNYNYAHCLAERLCTIFDQTQPVEEVIVLDDASTDDSISIIERIAGERQRDLTLVINETNSGSVFAQWNRAVEMARGEFIWIAEADDLSDPAFLSRLVSMTRADPDIRLAFSDSRSIDGEGAAVYPSYKGYYASVEPGALTGSEVFDGKEFVARFLSVKNLILNVSAVLWRRDALRDALAACRGDLDNYRLAGDWRIYLAALTAPGARIAYATDTLNVHRRHAQSVTHSLKARRHVNEIARIHGVVRGLLDLPGQTVARQRGYVEKVARQFQPDMSAAPPAVDKPIDARIVN
jgi:glycosyltransferase involved in cell wall biosynthesis